MKAHRIMLAPILFLVLVVGAGLLSGIFLREAWRRNLLFGGQILRLRLRMTESLPRKNFSESV